MGKEEYLVQTIVKLCGGMLGQVLTSFRVGLLT
jgi:hypothetical protein